MTVTPNPMQDALKYAEQIAYSSKEVLQFTYDMAVKYRDSQGIYLEAGVAAGAQIIALKAGAPDKIIYAFDSYAGIPLPSNRDDQMPGISFFTKTEQAALPNPGEQQLMSSGATIVPLEHVKKHIIDSGLDLYNIIFVEGWFEETVPKFNHKFIPPYGIDILRLDGDLYHSTYICLKHLFPRTVDLSCVIIDDWSLSGCRAACEDYFKSINYEPNYYFLDGTAYFFV